MTISKRVSWLAATAVMALAISCGSSDGGNSGSATKTWSVEYRSNVLSGCQSGAKETRVETTTTQATVYCVCVIEEAQKRYSETDFDAHAFEYMEAMKADGTTGRCSASAGIK